MSRTGAFLVALWVLAWPAPGIGQPATLVADRIALEGGGALVAEGSVEVLFADARLQARRIRYDRRDDTITLEGPLRIDDGDGFVLLGDEAELSRDLRDGLVRGARLVLAERLQMAADTVARAEGRYTRLDRVVASSCEVCARNPTPLWEIRAARVVHDQRDRQIYFDRAQFRILGVPVFFVPRLRVPDPTNRRATGFLVPEFRATSRLGPGVRLPYFIALDDDRDLTLTPYVAQRHTATIEGRYRHAFSRGAAQIEAGLSRDSIREGRTRGFVLGGGRFALADRTMLDMRLEAASDRTYLEDYGHTSRNLLTSGAVLTRTRRASLLRAEGLAFRSLRSDDINAMQPGRVGRLSWQHRFAMPGLGGTGRARIDLLALHRSARADIVGRDAARVRGAFDWRRNRILPGGIEATLAGELVADQYAIAGDSRFARHITRVTPQAALELRWPWQRSESSGAVQVIEPVAQLIWARPGAARVPNDDSRIVEFDEGNLFALDRAPGADARELGRRANLGISWTRHAPEGWSAGATLGRVLRADDGAGFAPLSGLSGRRSDWLAAVQLRTAQGLSVTNRALFDSSFDLTKAEMRLGWQTPRLDLATTLAHVSAEPAEARPSTTSEWSLDAQYAITDDWSARADWRYDLASGDFARAGFGVTLQNECALVDLSLSRRFVSSTRVEASTNIGLSVELLGFGGGGGRAGGGCGT